jgi:hypothetical protein
MRDAAHLACMQNLFAALIVPASAKVGRSATVGDVGDAFEVSGPVAADVAKVRQASTGVGVGSHAFVHVEAPDCLALHVKQVARVTHAPPIPAPCHVQLCLRWAPASAILWPSRPTGTLAPLLAFCAAIPQRI